MAAPSFTLGTPGSADTLASAHTVALPAGTGHKGVVFFGIGAADLDVASTNYVEGGGFDLALNTRRVVFLYRENTTDTSISVTTGTDCRAAWIPFITDGDMPALVASAGSTLGSTANPDPDALAGMPLADYRVLAIALIADSRGTISAYPTNYADNQADVKAGAANGRPHLAIATRALTAITGEDPGVYTLSAARNSLGWTIAIPAGGAAPVTGTLAETQADQTVAASGLVSIIGTVAETQDAQTVAAAGLVSGAVITGSLAETQADQTVAAAGTSAPPVVTGTLAETQANQTLAASGIVGRAVPTGLAANEIGVIGHSNVGTFISHYRTLSGLDLITSINQGGLHIIFWGDPGQGANYTSAWTKLADEEPVGGYRAIWLMLGFHPSYIGTYDDTDFQGWADHIAGRLATDYPDVEYIWWSPMNTYFTADHGDGDAADLIALDPWGTNPTGIVEHGVSREVSTYSWDTTQYAIGQGYADDYGPWINLTAENTHTDGRHPSEPPDDPAPNGQTHGGEILFEFFDGAAIAGSLAETQDAQTLAATGRVSIIGSLAETQDAQTVAAAGTVSVAGVAGTLAETQADQTLAAAGLSAPPVFSGTVAETQANQTLSAAGTFAEAGVIAGSVNATQADQTVAATGTFTPDTVTGSVAETQDAQSSSAAGTSTPPSFTGSLAETQADQTLQASGSLITVGTLAETQDDQTLSASGTSGLLVITGSLNETQDDQTSSTIGSGREQSGSISVGEQTGSLVMTGGQT